VGGAARYNKNSKHCYLAFKGSFANDVSWLNPPLSTVCNLWKETEIGTLE